MEYKDVVISDVITIDYVSPDYSSDVLDAGCREAAEEARKEFRISENYGTSTKVKEWDGFDCHLRLKLKEVEFIIQVKGSGQYFTFEAWCEKSVKVNKY